MFNLPLKEGVVPFEWKEANIVPLFKKGSRNKSDNYRPVRILRAKSPQGSVLGLLLFLIYINDLDDDITRYGNLWVTQTCLERLQMMEIDSIHNC